VITFALVFACYRAPPAPTGPVELPSAGFEQDLAATQAFAASRPEYERPLGDGLSTVPGLPDLSARTCGACHPAIYEAWASSTHAHAWTDRQYQAEIGKSGNRWLCLNCHTPLRAQQDLWPVGLVDGDVERPQLVRNVAFDAALRDEGITCAVCHVRDGRIVGPGLVGGPAPPHPVQADPTFLAETAMCERCHQAVAEYPGKGFVCTFRTGEEWRAGPYDDEGVGCVDCHMARSAGPAAVGGPERAVAHHGWRGAGIPKVAGVQPPVETRPPGLDVTAAREGDALVVRYQNALAGHMLPTGDPERWVQIDVVFVDAGGATVASESTRIGQVWTWWPAPEKQSDNRLAPREARSWSLGVPAVAVGATVTASSHRMTPETADYHHLGDYPRSVVTHTLTVGW
jgi:hypothetical protein